MWPAIKKSHSSFGVAMACAFLGRSADGEGIEKLRVGNRRNSSDERMMVQLTKSAKGEEVLCGNESDL